MRADRRGRLDLAPIGAVGLTYGLLTSEYLEVAAGLALFGLAARSLGR